MNGIGVFRDIRSRALVSYNGYAEATRVPPSWHGWMHHTVDIPPTEEAYTPREWEKPHLPNLTGTPLAYRPSGSTRASGPRPPPTVDAGPKSIPRRLSGAHEVRTRNRVRSETCHNKGSHRPSINHPQLA